ncbi:hypothetical protein ACLOJK_012776 [Asimina triloba]
MELSSRPRKEENVWKTERTWPTRPSKAWEDSPLRSLSGLSPHSPAAMECPPPFRLFSVTSAWVLYAPLRKIAFVWL